MSNPALHPDRREITTYPAMTADWSVRTLVPCVLVAARLTDDAADLAQLPEITPVSFQWPGLLERASRIVTGAGAVLLEMFLAEHQGRPSALPPTYQVLREGLGPEVLDAADDARIAVLPHQIGQHAYYTATVGVQLLHLRHGAHSGEIRRLRDAAQVSFLDLQQDVAQWQLSHPADVGLPAELPAGARTAWPLPVRAPAQRRVGA